MYQTTMIFGLDSIAILPAQNSKRGIGSKAVVQVVSVAWTHGHLVLGNE